MKEMRNDGTTVMKIELMNSKLYDYKIVQVLQVFWSR